MKILHITPTYLPAYRYGGPIISVHGMNKWLVENGAEVTVYTTDIDGPDRLNVPLGAPVLVDGVKVFYFPKSLGFWFYSFALHKKLAETVKDFDLVHITSVFLAVSVLGTYYAKKFGKPCVISPRGSLMHEPLRHSALKKRLYISLVERYNLLRASAIHFTDEAEKKEYIEEGFPLRRSILVPNGLDFEPLREKVQKGEFRRKYGVAGDKRIVLFLSRINWKKGLDTLIPAFKKVLEKEPRAVLVIAGGDDEGYKKKVEEFIAKANIPEKVIFTGMIQGKDKLELYADSYVFVLPSYSENFGMAVAEAMYVKLPVVVTRGVALSKEVQEGRAGLVVSKDENEVEAAIVKLLTHHELAREMGENGRNIIEREFALPKIAGRFIKEYRALIG